MRLALKVVRRCRAACSAFRSRALLRPLFSSARGRAVIAKNRETLRLIPEWIEEERWRSSVFGYGLPSSVRHLIDVPLDDSPTYSDLIVLLADRLSRPLTYLEVGVSVGKNLVQVLRANPGATAVALDIEEINPPLTQGLTLRREEHWDSTSDLRPVASLREYVDPAQATSLTYICADELDVASWTHLTPRKFNMIFFDALHEPHALLHEYRMLQENDLLATEQFVMIWDDLVPELRAVFDTIAQSLCARYGKRRLRSEVFEINGWLGSSESPHQVGVVTVGLAF